MKCISARTFRRDRIEPSQPQHQLQSTAIFWANVFIFQIVQVQFLPSFWPISTSKQEYLVIVYRAQSQRVLSDQFSYSLKSFGLSVLCLSFYFFGPFSPSADLVCHLDTYSKDHRYGMDFSVLGMTYFGVFAPEKLIKIFYANNRAYFFGDWWLSRWFDRFFCGHDWCRCSR